MSRIRTHPGEILQEEFLIPLGLTANALARALHVPANRITAIIADQRGITADTALRLACYFGTTPQFWLNLQTAHDLSLAQAARGNDISRTITPHASSQPTQHCS
ncbi:Virulence-associated protein I [Granulibacter bethesdensis]|uniref:Virulence-associated protein I n=1 Tax=Granulibacter bethesdensis TaxID=364410 RepID=A0AAN0RE58_9PROT|nr:HigA family addiction module antitoxin [Granulibacter bethesdensis]AHJ63268.1 Virulence-associated protein I [Granulibacter bethesdensis]